MKKFILMVVMALFAVTTLSAQDRGQWGVAPKVGIYTNVGINEAIFGLGAAARYSFTDNLRIEPSISVLFHENCSIDLSADVHYLFNLCKAWDIYPLVGIGVNQFYDWSCSLNLGVGTDFHLTDRWDLTASMKWMVETAEGFQNPILISVGGVYKF